MSIYPFPHTIGHHERMCLEGALKLTASHALQVAAKAAVTEIVGKMIACVLLILQPTLTLWFVYGTWILYADGPEFQGTSENPVPREGSSR
jgi:hypothetical protein